MSKTVIQRAISSIATAAVCIFALFTFTHNKADVDLWGNVGFVKALPTSIEFEHTNTFSYTEPQHDWINHEWMSEYIFNRTYTAFGNPGLLILKSLLGFILLGIIYTALRRGCKSGTLRFLYLMLIISTIGYGFSTRPHLFTYILTAALLSYILRKEIPILLAAAAAPLGCLWANLHGAFFTGELILIIALCYQMIATIKKQPAASKNSAILAASAILFFAGTLLNPYGIKLWSFVFDSAAITRPILSEWAPFNPIAQAADHTDFIILTFFTLIAIALSFRTCNSLNLIVIGLALAAAFAMRRNIPTFAIVAGIAAPSALGHAFGKQLDSFKNKMQPTFLLILLAVIAAVPALFFINRNLSKRMQIVVDRRDFPVDAINFLKANHISANAIVFFDWAEQSIWQLYPGIRVFMDGRFRSAYSQNTITDYLDFIYAGSQFNNALEDYPTDMVFTHIGNPCTKTMLNQKGWTAIYRDNIAVIFVKNSVHTELLQKLRAGMLKLPPQVKAPTFP